MQLDALLLQKNTVQGEAERIPSVRICSLSAQRLNSAAPPRLFPDAATHGSCEARGSGRSPNGLRSHAVQHRRQTGTAEALAEAAYRSARRSLWKHPAQSDTPLPLIIPCMRTFVKQGRRVLLSLTLPGRVFWRGIERGTARSLKMVAARSQPFFAAVHGCCNAAALPCTVRTSEILNCCAAGLTFLHLTCAHGHAGTGNGVWKSRIYGSARGGDRMPSFRVFISSSRAAMASRKAVYFFSGTGRISPLDRRS